MREFPAWLLVGLLLSWFTMLQAEMDTLEPTALAHLLEGRDPPLVLDVRGRGAYLKGTLPGALDAGSDPAGFLPDGRGGEVVLVTAVETHVDAWLKRLGDFNYRVRVVMGGFTAWRAAGLPVEQPEASYTRPGTVPFVIPRGLCEGEEPAQVYE